MDFWANYIDFSRPTFVILVVVIVITVLSALGGNGKDKNE